MIASLFNSLINFIMFFLKGIGNLLTLPIQWALLAFFPDLGSFISTFLTFMNNSFFTTMKWVRMSLINIVLMPSFVWSFIILTITMLYAGAPIFRSLRLLYNIWQVWRGTQK